jgi:hypothetical protein
MNTHVMPDDSNSNKKRPGIKSRYFTSSGTNGTSHRKGAAARKARHQRNMSLRADLYSKFQGRNSGGKDDAREFHSVIEALSKGTA